MNHTRLQKPGYISERSKLNDPQVQHHLNSQHCASFSFIFDDYSLKLCKWADSSELLFVTTNHDKSQVLSVSSISLRFAPTNSSHRLSK